MALQANADVQVRVGSTDLGTWTTKSGGAMTVSSTKFYPGGMQAEVAKGGLITVEDVTVTREQDDSMQSRIAGLRSQLNQSMTISVQPVDATGAPTGKADVYRGVLAGVTPTDADASSNNVAMITLTMSSHGTIS